MIDAFLNSLSNSELAILLLSISVAFILFVVISIVLATSLSKKKRELDDVSELLIQNQIEFDKKLDEEEKELNFYKSEGITKTNFVAEMASDVRKALNITTDYVGLIKRNIDKQDQIIKYIEKIDVTIQDLLYVNNKAYNLAIADSTLNTLDEELFDINNFVSQILNEYAIKAEIKNIDLHYVLKNLSNTKVIADKEKLYHIVSNILSNAINFTAENGKIKCTLQQETSDLLRYGMFVITIQDNGCGISEEFIKTIYDVFSLDDDCSNKESQGTGIGMTIVQKNIEALGGKVDIKSEIGVGTSVEISIPMRLSDIENTENLSDAELVVKALKNKKVLLVEDDKKNVDFITNILKGTGLDIECATSGISAVEKVKDKLNRNTPNYYDFVLLNIDLSEMDGYEVSSKIRSLLDPKNVHVPIIGITNQNQTAMKEKALKAGIDSYIDKTININVLLNILAKFVTCEE